MRILLINANMYHQHGFLSELVYKLNSNPILVLAQIAGATPPGHELKLLDDRYDDPFSDDEYDLVGISCVTPSAPRAYEIADWYRNQGNLVVLGGIHPTAMPEEAKQHADAVVIGEAEASWPQVLKDAETGSLQPFYRQHQPITPDKIAIPQHELLRVQPLFTAVAPSRGCPYHCSFCTLTHMHGSEYRPRPIESVVEEIKRSPRRFLVFLHDASLTINPDYAKALFKAMIPLKRNFIAYGSAPVLFKDDELLKLSKQAGCVIWCVGFESICQDSLMNDAQKRYTVENYDALVKKIHNNHMSMFGSFVFGFDHDTPDIFDKTLQAAYDFGIDAAEFNILTPFPITRLFKQLEQDGRILTRDWTKYDLHHVVFRPKLMTPEELHDGFSHVSNKFYSPLKTMQRIANVTLKNRRFPNILVVGGMNAVMFRFHLEYTLF